jgi:hypothetical protein
LLQNRPSIGFVFDKGQRVNFVGARHTIVSFPAKSFGSAALAEANTSRLPLPRLPPATARSPLALVADTRSPATEMPPVHNTGPMHAGEVEDVEPVEDAVIWDFN